MIFHNYTGFRPSPTITHFRLPAMYELTHLDVDRIELYPHLASLLGEKSFPNLRNVSLEEMCHFERREEWVPTVELGLGGFVANLQSCHRGITDLSVHIVSNFNPDEIMRWGRIWPKVKVLNLMIDTPMESPMEFGLTRDEMVGLSGRVASLKNWDLKVLNATIYVYCPMRQISGVLEILSAFKGVKNMEIRCCRFPTSNLIRATPANWESLTICKAFDSVTFHGAVTAVPDLEMIMHLREKEKLPIRFKNCICRRRRACWVTQLRVPLDERFDD